MSDWAKATTSMHARVGGRCDVSGCTNVPQAKGLCRRHLRELPVRDRPARAGVARERAEKLIEAWLVADYEPDEVNGSYMSERSLERLIERVAAVYDGQQWPAPAAGKHPSQMSPRQRLLAQGVVTLGTPREASRDVAGEDLTSPDCPAYSLCLDHAVQQGWQRWTCRGCAGPGTADIKRTPGGKHG